MRSTIMPFSIEKYHLTSELIFDGLSQRELKLLREQTTRIEIKKNKLLFKEGSYSKGVYILKKGKVKIFQLNKSGEEQIAYIYSKSDVLGYRPLLCNEVHPVSAMALEDCQISFIPKKCFLDVLDESIMLSKRLLETLSHEFTVWVNTLSLLAQQPVRERVALVLLILNEQYRRNGEVHTVINLSRDNMAGYARTTVETLARVLRLFKDEKIIKTEGRKITILKKTELEKINDLY